MRIRQVLQEVWVTNGLVLALACSYMTALSAADPATLRKPLPAGRGTKDTGHPSVIPRSKLSTSGVWRLQPPSGERFDASALLQLPDGSLVTVNDRGPAVYRIQFRATDDVADLVPAPDVFSTNGLTVAGGSIPVHYDAEGLARDEAGRVYLSEESRRQIYRFDPISRRCEVLPIDWARVSKFFDKSDSNASFEGVAVGGSTLYVANERKVGRIISVDLESLRVTGHFQVTPQDRPAADVHYSDLSWFAGELWVLCRESRCVLRVDPEKRQVRSEYDYSDVELARANAYYNPYPGYGFVEGLAVDQTNIWLAVDNNNFPRIADRDDRRPTLFRCPRPDVATRVPPR